MHGTYKWLARASVRLLSPPAVFLAAAAFSPHDAGAQGLLDRIESRVRSRIEAYRAVPPGGEQVGPEQQPLSNRDARPRDRDARPQDRDARPQDRDARPRGRPAPTLGVQARASTELITGVQILRFFSHSQAANAGLLPGDLVVAINGSATPSIAAIGQELSRHEVGDTVLLAVVRSGQLVRTEVPLVENLVSPGERGRYDAGSRRWIPPLAATPAVPRPFAEPRVETGRPDAADPPPLPEPERVPRGAPGNRSSQRSQSPQRSQASQSEREPAIDSVLGAEVTDDPESRGATVRNVNPKSPAAKAGLRVDDRIVAVDGRVVRGSADLNRQIGRYEPGRTVALQAVRGDAFVELQAELADPSDPVAQNEPATSAAEPSPDTATSKPKGSLLDSLGSAVGGLFGDKSAKPAKPSEETASPKSGEQPPLTERPQGTTPSDESADDQESAAEELPAPTTSDSR